MALKLIEGFDEGLLVARGWQRSTSTVTGRFGGGALNTGTFPSGASTYYFAQPISGTIVIGFAAMPIAKGVSFLAFGAAYLGTSAAGALTLSNSSTLVATSPSAYWTGNVWRYVELKYTTTTGACTVRIDGTVVLTGTVATVASIGGFTYGPNQDQCYVDDLYVLDSTGTVNNDFLGDVRVQALYPNVDGTYNDLTPSTGTAHAVLVDEPAPNTTDYVSSSLVGAKDSYQFQDLSPGTANVFGLLLTNYSRKDAAASAAMKNLARVAGVDYVMTGKNLSTSWTGYSDLLELNPGTSSLWTPADVNAAEFGVETA